MTPRLSGRIKIIWILIVVIIIGAIMFGISTWVNSFKKRGAGGKMAPTATWVWNGQAWEPTGTPTQCPDPLTLQSPVDLTKASAILYPGQTRGGLYKAHGGFLFAGQPNNAITVKAPMDATVIRGSQYSEQGETQYLFDLLNSCGILMRFDHLNTLAPAFQHLTESFPPPTQSSETHDLTVPLQVKAGDTIATAVGFTKTNNTGVDWGVYDLRTINTSAQDPWWATSHNAELTHYGVCWLNWLSPTDQAKVKSLPGGDQAAGKTSDYCK